MQAIKQINTIMLGAGVIDRNDYPEKWKSLMAKDLWNNSKFHLGMEYGYILGLLRAFNITEKEVE